jgi:hypothetical protein
MKMSTSKKYFLAFIALALSMLPVWRTGYRYCARLTPASLALPLVFLTRLCHFDQPDQQGKQQVISCCCLPVAPAAPLQNHQSFVTAKIIFSGIVTAYINLSVIS